MPLISARSQVLNIYSRAARQGWVLPVFNSENLTTTEAILASALAYSKKTGIEGLPVIVGITSKYQPRPQAVYYSHTRQWDIGMQLFLQELEVLTSAKSPYAGLKVMVHLDHIQWDDDKELLEWDMGRFSSIMYDASALPLEMNMEKTAQFVRQNAHKILIEGACDVIGPASGEAGGLTSPDDAYHYMNRTGVDIIVANLGTEHRAAAAELRYQSHLAQQITARLGKGCLCLHGASSVPVKSLGRLFEDGIRKVNIWTALERESSVVLMEEMLKNIAKVIGPKKTSELKLAGLLGETTDDSPNASVDYCTTTYRQGLVFETMKKLVTTYLDVFYKL